MNPTAILRKLVLLVATAAAMLATIACTDPYAPDKSHTGHAPEGYFSFEPKFQASKVQTVISRGLNNDPLLDKIDNVFVFIFKDTNGEEGIQEDDRLEYREYYQYGVVQSIYLKKDETYFVYVVANLDESNIPDGMGSLHTFFDDVEFYGDLVNKYVQFRVISPAETGKIIMTTDDPKKALTSNGGPTAYSKDGIITIKYNEDDEVFAPHVDLFRLQARFVVNIYNRVISDTDRSNASGVTPTSINAANFPRKSFLVRHLRDYVDTNGDGVIDGAATGEFYSSAPMLLPAPQAELVQYNYAANDGYRTSYYTKQTVEYFCFENRRGGPKSPLNTYVPKDADGNPITEYEDETPIPTDIPDVYGRNELAPNFSSHLMLLSMTDKDVLRIFAHAGKGRNVDNPDTPPGDDESNFDVDRNCVYHFNIIINGTKNVIIDSRSEYLTQRVLYYMPEDARVDAHYVDMPSYIKGKKEGMAKLQAGTVPSTSCIFDSNDEVVEFNYDANGVPIGWEAMTDDITNNNNWVRFSWANPYKPTRSSTAGSGEPTTSKLYVTMRERQEAGMVDGISSATPILHINEFVENGGVGPYPGSTGTNPPKRIAAIRVGFKENVSTVAAYESSTENDYPFFRPVTQYGLKTIGQLGGWNGEMYTSMLGVESIEEHTVKHYAIAGKTPDNNTLGGPWWWYTLNTTSENHPYDGKGSTVARYERYRTSRGFTGGVPPVRGAALSNSNIDNITGFDGIYNPYSQTNAVDYCMRKNRDENGDGIISGNEVKWYLPSPAQAMQMYPWRDLFRGVSADLKESYTLNEGGGVNYIPFGPYKSGTGSVSSNYYWTTNEVDGSNALVVDFSSTLTTNVVSQSKTKRAAVR
ncbi:hypothetical protein LJC72_05165, partial [Bacteroides sp. OttesenSCG-928-D19]|nr:hypothetical protein [Bacteroides sp. OttesenSCG-928-D19]